MQQVIIKFEKDNFLNFQNVMSDEPPIEAKVDVLVIEKTESITFLVVIINETLKWNDHVKYIAPIISCNVGILFKLRHYVLLDILFTLYNTKILLFFFFVL